MIGRSIRLAACVSVLTAWLLGPLSVQAVTPTSLTMDMDSSITVGVHPTVMVRLTGPAGPVAGAAVQVQLDGRQTMRVVTDLKGEATTVLARDLDAGDYQIQAVFRGTADLVASVSSPVTLHVNPATFTVRTVPAIAGLPLLRVDRGSPLSTAADGTITIPIPEVRRYELDVILPPPEPKRELTFDRWGDGSRDTTRSIRLPGRSDLVIGLERKHLVEFGFVDSTGAPVDPQRIESLLIANDRGEVMQPGALEPTWLIENRIMRVGGQLSSVPIEYRLQEVGVRGSNVVDRGRLHFSPDGAIDTWVVPLLLYSLTISGQDALFGYPIGTSVRLVHPNGSTESVPLDERASATISALPRGNYTALVEHPPGFPVSTPLVLSRDQSARLPVVSYVDAVFVLGTGLSVAIALVLAGGRPVGRAGRRGLRRIGHAVATVLLLPAKLVRAVARPVRAVDGRIRRLVARPSRALAPTPTVTGATTMSATGGPMAIALGDAAQLAGSAPAMSLMSLASGPGERVHRFVPCRYCGSKVTWRARLCRTCGRRLRKS
jgi:hypothetical protein